MAASNIPNLSTLRSAHGNSRSSGRGRGRGRGPPQGNPPPPSVEEGEDNKNNQAAAKAKIIQSTDQDASISRWSAVQAGYLHDPFAHLFTPSPAPRRFPIINRGTYVRTTAIDNLVSLFLSQSPSIPKQIISLGAGSDTRFFRLSSSSPSPLIYHELDFAPNTAAKIITITSSPALTQQIHPPITVVDPARDALHSPNYHIHPTDLRTLDPSSPLPHINPDLPTLLISECCLCYLPPEAADSVITFFTTHLFPPTTPLGMLLYEPIKPSDAFGRVMVANLAARGIELHTLTQYGSLDAQRERLRKYGFGGGGGGGGGNMRGEGCDSVGAGGGVRARDVDECWEEGVSAEEKRRVAGLEMVDEVEEWRLLAQHYCVAWGWRDREGGSGAEGEGGGVGGGGRSEKVESENDTRGESGDDDVWKRWRAES